MATIGRIGAASPPRQEHRRHRTIQNEAANRAILVIVAVLLASSTTQAVASLETAGRQLFTYGLWGHAMHGEGRMYTTVSSHNENRKVEMNRTVEAKRSRHE